MPRIRTVKPEFWSSPSTAGADPWVRLLYIAMWNWADDHGRGTANVKELAAFAFPHDDDPGAPTSTELPCMLAEIAGRFSVVFYEADGRRYYAIPSWDRHQRNERRAASRYPAPEDGKPYNPDPSDQRKAPEWRVLHGVSDDEHGTSVQDDGSSGSGTGEQGNRGSSTSVTDADASAEMAPKVDPLDVGFAEFWADWPRKVGKADAKVKYRTARKRGVTAERIRDAAQRQADAWAAERKDPKYIPHPATWLHQGRYDDEIERPKFRVINNPESAWDGIRIPTGESGWAPDTGWAQ